MSATTSAVAAVLEQKTWQAALELRRQVDAGQRLSLAEIGQLGALCVRSSAQVQDSLIASVLLEAKRAGDGAPIAALPAAPSLVDAVLHRVGNIGPLDSWVIRALAELAARTGTRSLDRTMAWTLRIQLDFGMDITCMADWIFAQLALRRLGGTVRRDAAHRLIAVLATALCQNRDRQRQADEARRTKAADFVLPDRVALQMTARDVFLGPLGALVADRTRPAAERSDLRRIVVAVAVNDQRWSDVDALGAATPEKELASMAFGLALGADMLAPDSAHGSAAAKEVVARLEALRPQLADAARKHVDDCLRKLTDGFGFTHRGEPADASDATAR